MDFILKEQSLFSWKTLWFASGCDVSYKVKNISVNELTVFLKYVACGWFIGSRPDFFCKKGILRNFTKFVGKHFIKEETLAQVFSCKFFKISKSTFY